MSWTVMNVQYSTMGIVALVASSLLLRISFRGGYIAPLAFAFAPSPRLPRQLVSRAIIPNYTSPLHKRQITPKLIRRIPQNALQLLPDGSDTNEDYENSITPKETIWEQMAVILIGGREKYDTLLPTEFNDFVQYISLLRVGIPALGYATVSKLIYPSLAMTLAVSINDSAVFAVVSQDASQYIQNILTVSGLVFSLLVGQTYYFMYQQQEKTYFALYEEVSVAKMLLEQIALVCQGREVLYHRILQQMDTYIRTDLRRFNDIEPAIMISTRPCDDPLEDILFLTSVGEPSSIYQTVRSLRQARAFRLAALQRKLPSIHMTLLWVLAAIVLFTFPLLGAGVQTIGGTEILLVQSWYLAFIVFGMSLTLGVIYELRRPGKSGAYNARTVLAIMVAGLEQELEQRLQGQTFLQDERENASMYEPSIDSDGSFDPLLLPSQYL